MADGKPVLCPSSSCKEGAILLGVIMSDGKVTFAPEGMVVTKDFVEVAKKGRSPEKRFRFSSACLQSACKQWTGSRCGVIDTLVGELRLPDNPLELPACSIRTQCRWYKQHQAGACQVCPRIITDMTVSDSAFEGFMSGHFG